jgi:serine/threonine-protein kinase
MKVSDLEKAREVTQRALSIREQALGPDHGDTATTRGNLAQILMYLGRLEEAMPQALQSLDAKAKAMGRDSVVYADGLDTVGQLLTLLKRPAEGEARLREAVALYESKYPLGHHRASVVLSHLGDTLTELGKYDDALGAYRRAVTGAEKAVGARSPALAEYLVGLAEAELRANHPAQAHASAARALALLTSDSASPTMLRAVAMFVQAQVAAQRGEVRTARDLAEGALAYARLRDQDEALRKKIEAYAAKLPR